VKRPRRTLARGTRAGLWIILRDAPSTLLRMRFETTPSTLLRMRRWLAPRQSPTRRRSIRFLKSKPEFALLARKCLFFRSQPFVGEGARRQPALCQSWPGSALFDRPKAGAKWTPPRSKLRRFQIGGGATAFRGSQPGSHSYDTSAAPLTRAARDLQKQQPRP